MSDMQPCEQRDEIAAIKKKLDDRDSMLMELRVKQAEIGGDVAHIKTRIDNGMSHTLQRIDMNLMEIKPVIAHHSDIVKRIEDIGWLWSRYSGIGLIALLLGLIVWAITNGFNV